MNALVNEAPFMSTSELETVGSLCFRALDGSNYDVRCAVAKLLGNLLATAQNPKTLTGKNKPAKLEDVLNILASGFLKGGMGFLKGSTAGEMIKGSASVNREIRVGITHAYVELIKCMGGLWLERNISVFLNHVLDLVANPRATPTHVDAVYARKCVLFIMRSVIGGMLGEKAQIAAAKEICQIIIKQMNTVGEATVDASEGKSQAADLTASQHVLVCALHELGSLVLRLGTSASPLVAEPATGIIEPVVSVLIHPSHAARLSASWCLGSIAVALPSQLTPLLDRCVERMEKLKSSPEAVSGYSSALASLLGGVYQCPLGIPHAKGKQIFSIAEELLRTASQNSRLSLQRTQSGWLLLGALMTLGSSVIKNHLPRMLLLWRNAFPRSSRELEAEKVRGDAFTWQVTLEGRAGALGVMYSFLLHCRDLVTEDVIRRMLAPLECALLMMGHLANVIKMYGTHLKASAAMIRLRLYDVLSLLPPESFEGMYPNLLRELVAEFTLTDNPANTTTSQLRSMCHVDDSVILGSWLQETDHKAIEDQLEPNRRVDKENLQPNSASGSGALEHDAQSVYLRCPPSDPIPGPLPLGVAVIDSSVKLYGVIFPRVAHKHRYQMLQHFIECIRQAKSSRQQAVQMNIFTAVLCALKSLTETKTTLGQEDDALGSSNPILRCAAGEALGRLAQVVGDSKFIAEMAQHSFDKLKSARDVVSRTGHSLALGCLHRYVGGLGSGQHLNTSVSILLALAQDFNSPVVQIWALHALSLIADSGGPMFRGYVEPTLSLVLQLLLTVPPATVDVHQCLGKCLSALITSIGPELQMNTGAVATARLSCLVCCAIMQDHPDSLVQAEAIACLQQLHMFAPRHVNLNTLVPHLCDILSSSHLLLRRAAVACLRQLVTREAKEVSAMALTLAGEGKDGRSSSNISESGLEGALFSMLDEETDGKLVSDVQDTLVSLLQALAITNLTRWLQLLKDVLSASTVLPRWPTKVFAVECLMKIMVACEEGEGQYDLVRAKELKQQSDHKGSFLVFHLSDLIRMAFIAATSDNNQLRLAGMAALEEIIRRFAKVPEPEFPGCVILEQYQAQVGAVCSKWIGSGVARDLNDLRRVHQLLVKSLAKLNTGKARTQLYNESATTMEKLAVIRAWAEVYIVAINREKESQAARLCQGKDEKEEDESYEHSGESLLSLVQPELANLSSHWFHALKDHALLSLPPEYSSQLPQEGGAFYHPDTVDSVKIHYRKSWPPILYALAIWLNEKGFARLNGDGEATPDVPKPAPGSFASQPANAMANMKPEEVNKDRLFLILGICMESLCSTTAMLEDETVVMCLQALYVLLDSTWPRRQLAEDPVICRELLNVMHRVILTRDSVEIHQHAISMVKQVLRAAQEIMDSNRARAKEKEMSAPESSTDSMDTTDSSAADTANGEGGTTGDFVIERSIVFATLEVCLCALVRHLPALNPAAPSTGFQVPTHQTRLPETTFPLLSSVVLLMPDLMHLCSPMGAVTILPTILHLTTSVVRELAARGADTKAPTVIAACLQTLKLLCSNQLIKDEGVGGDWVQLLQSAVITVLHYGKPGEDCPGINQGVMVQVLTVFITSCPREVTGATNLQKPVLDCFREAWDDGNIEVRLKCVQSLISILQHPDRQVAPPYIQGLASRMIEHLHTTMASKTPPSDADLTLTLEELCMMETLVALAEDNKRVTMVALLVPILVSLLLDEQSIKSANANRRRLSDSALQKLLRLGQQHPEQFKQVMGMSAHLRPRLEAAVKLSQASQAQAKARSEAKAPSQPKKPTITLTMDFSKKFSS
ncbi:hypothetical protein BaRGS_00001800 [Batillaria attramentaria]|uniref:LAA1-like C-terminal TPR repeats domain-containing protein n=1 Tax=Batillaria attramentaria TaxID=370345 RepID=A0ABD0M6A4_9CAEN